MEEEWYVSPSFLVVAILDREQKIAGSNGSILKLHYCLTAILSTLVLMGERLMTSEPFMAYPYPAIPTLFPVNWPRLPSLS